MKCDSRESDSRLERKQSLYSCLEELQVECKLLKEGILDYIFDCNLLHNILDLKRLDTCIGMNIPENFSNIQSIFKLKDGLLSKS